MVQKKKKQTVLVRVYPKDKKRIKRVLPEMRLVGAERVKYLLDTYEKEREE